MFNRIALDALLVLWLALSVAAYAGDRCAGGPPPAPAWLSEFHRK